ncbi:hypothetical protein [Bordetella flabilis]|nr:hypothetical protein [Bordetella flabilis]
MARATTHEVTTCATASFDTLRGNAREHGGRPARNGDRLARA